MYQLLAMLSSEETDAMNKKVKKIDANLISKVQQINMSRSNWVDL